MVLVHKGRLVLTPAFLVSIHANETPWVLKDWHTSDLRIKRNAIIDGALFGYCKILKLYRCRTVEKETLRTYAVADAMNCKGWDSKRLIIKNRMKIKNAAYRIVFLDDGGTSPAALGGWTLYAVGQREEWWDPPPVRHGDGTTFSFADGHSEYHKWTDPRTIEFGKRVPPKAWSGLQSGNEDLRWAAIATWGR